jgi:hypothetical protein
MRDVTKMKWRGEQHQLTRMRARRRWIGGLLSSAAVLQFPIALGSTQSEVR